MPKGEFWLWNGNASARSNILFCDTEKRKCLRRSDILFCVLLIEIFKDRTQSQNLRQRHFPFLFEFDKKTRQNKMFKALGIFQPEAKTATFNPQRNQTTGVFTTILREPSKIGSRFRLFCFFCVNNE